MNAYFDNTSYGRNIVRDRVAPRHTYGDGLISFICAIVGMLTCSVAVKIEKSILSVVLLIAFVGVVGGVDSGSLSMLGGLALGGIISLIEYATLKSIFTRAK